MRLGMSNSGEFMRLRFITIMLTLVLAAVFVFIRIREPFLQAAELYAYNYADKLINDSVNEVCGKYTDYYKPSSIQNNENISSLESDSLQINRLKSEIVSNIRNKLSGCKNEKIHIPLGSVTGNELLSALGIDIPVYIRPINLVKADLEDDFDSAGINQVRHTIYINISITVSFIGFGTGSEKTVTSKVPVSETVIIGEVPKYYSQNK